MHGLHKGNVRKIVQGRIDVHCRCEFLLAKGNENGQQQKTGKRKKENAPEDDYGKKTKPRYIYLRTEQELEKIAQEFNDCRYNNLFISCHGKKSSITTTYNKIEFSRFSEIFEGKLNGKRIFVSACLPGRGNQEFSDALYQTNPKMLSFISPAETVYFQSTYVFWTTFFYILSWKDSFNVTTINNILNICSNLFCIKFYWDGPISGRREQRYYGSHSYTRDDIENKNVMDSLLCVKRAIIEGMRKGDKDNN